MPTTNSLGTLAATGVLHDALGITLKNLPFLKRLASDIAPQMAERMMPFNVQQILKNYNAAQTVSDRSSTGTYAKQAGQTLPTDQTFTLDKWPYVSILLTATEVNQIVETYSNKDARALAIQKLLRRGFNAFATNIVNDFLDMFTDENFAEHYAVPTGTMTFNKLGSVVDVLLKNDALTEAPDAILEIDCFREFANSLTAITNASYNIDSIVKSAIVREGVSGAASVSRYNVDMPADAPRGIVFDPQAVVFANRVPVEEKLPNDPVYTEIITDSDSGFSVLYREAKDPLTGEVTRTITTLYGFGKGLSNHAVRINESSSSS